MSAVNDRALAKVITPQTGSPKVILIFNVLTLLPISLGTLCFATRGAVCHERIQRSTHYSLLTTPYFLPSYIRRPLSSPVNDKQNKQHG